MLAHLYIIVYIYILSVAANLYNTPNPAIYHVNMLHDCNLAYSFLGSLYQWEAYICINQMQ